VYHYDGQEINRSTAHVLSSFFSFSLEKKKDIEREKELQPLALPTVIKKKVVVCCT
jgi:hypothetical protein